MTARIDKCGFIHCDRCHAVVHNGRGCFIAEPPLCSLNAQYPAQLCKKCSDAFVRLSFEFMGLPVPPEYQEEKK